LEFVAQGDLAGISEPIPLFSGIGLESSKPPIYFRHFRNCRNWPPSALISAFIATINSSPYPMGSHGTKFLPSRHYHAISLLSRHYIAIISP
jgi:hypothetical protein